MTTVREKRPRGSKVKSGQNLELKEISITVGDRLNLEYYHVDGKYSSTEASLTIRAAIPQKGDPEAALNELKRIVRSEYQEVLREQLSQAIDRLNNPKLAFD